MGPRVLILDPEKPRVAGPFPTGASEGSVESSSGHTAPHSRVEVLAPSVPERVLIWRWVFPEGPSQTSLRGPTSQTESVQEEEVGRRRQRTT